jgi:hypothetical protein
LLLRAQFGDLMTEAEITDVSTAIRDQGPVGMQLFYDWLLRQPDTGELGGGADGLVSFNHPNRAKARIEGWSLLPAALAGSHRLR